MFNVTLFHIPADVIKFYYMYHETFIIFWTVNTNILWYSSADQT